MGSQDQNQPPATSSDKSPINNPDTLAANPSDQAPQPDLKEQLATLPSPIRPPEDNKKSFLPKVLVIIVLVAATLFTIMYAGVYMSLNKQVDKATHTPENAIKTQPSPTPNPNPTANFKTFINTKYGYTLKYPSYLFAADNHTYEYNKAPESNWVQLCPCPPGNKIIGPGAFDGPIIINTYKNSQGLTLSQYVKSSNPTANQLTTVIDNIPAIKIAIPVGKDSLLPVEEVFVLKDSYIYQVSSVKQQPYNDPKYRDLLDQILSTFKFLDQRSRSTKSGIHGRSIIGPQCPVVKNPPDDTCNDKPYPTVISIKNMAGKVLKTITTDEDGYFTLPMPEGKYILEGQPSKSMFPVSHPVTAVVNQNAVTEVTIMYDTGIR